MLETADGRRFDASEGLIIGRGQDVDVWIEEEQASRRHCRILPFEGGLVAIDLESRNGTRMDGARVTIARLHDGAVITIGATRLTLSWSGSAGSDGGAAEGAGDEPRLLSIVTRILGLGIEPDRLLSGIMDLIIAETGARRGFIVVAEPSGELGFRAARNMDRESIADPAFAVSYSLIEECCRSGKTVSLADAGRDDRFARSRSVRELRLRAVLVAPLRDGDRVTGAIYLDDAGRGAEDPTSARTLRGDSAELVRRLGGLIGRTIAGSLAVESLRVSHRRLEERIAAARARRTGRDRSHGLLGRSDAMQQTYRLIERFGASELPVLIVGESGTGKELAARAVHAESARREGPFVVEHCAAIAESLQDSELFGHVAGAFTGATEDRAGLFERAHGGTLFLDEIAELDLDCQAKILRVLEVGELRRIGGRETIRVDVRVLCATTARLATLAAEGRFREDLRFRLDVGRLSLPPLRDRRDDIPLLIEAFLDELEAEGGPDAEVTLSSRARERLVRAPWPGNVRQLRNELRRAAALGRGLITEATLSPELRGDGEEPSDRPLAERVKDFEAELILEALRAEDGQRSRTAARLGLSRQGLWKKIRDIWGEDGPPGPGTGS